MTPAMRKKLLTALFLILLPAAALASFPQPTGYVNDFAGILNPATKKKLESTLTAFDRKNGIEVAVATLPSLEGEPIENVAVDLFERWGIGKKGVDNGALFLIVPSDRRMRIEVGYGLEGAINDALAGRILKEIVEPRFKKGEMDAGVTLGTLAIVGVISDKENLGFDARSAAQTIAPSFKKKKSGPLGILGKIIMFLIMAYLFIRHPFLFLFFLSGMGGGVRRGGGGFGGGGFGGFGGGLSGGGGASGSW